MFSLAVECLLAQLCAQHGLRSPHQFGLCSQGVPSFRVKREISTNRYCQCEKWRLFLWSSLHYYYDAFVASPSCTFCSLLGNPHPRRYAHDLLNLLHVIPAKAGISYSTARHFVSNLLLSKTSVLIHYSLVFLLIAFK